tara:strand:+ start:1409 stop:1699 length:291 start_codon:yes stop_codon:yes gene_type:complete
MNLFLALLVAVSSWITFSTLNELASAKGGKGCCITKDCGTGILDSSLWWINLTVAIVFTMYVLMDVYMNHGSTVKSKVKSMIHKVPVAKSMKMVFG